MRVKSGLFFQNGPAKCEPGARRARCYRLHRVLGLPVARFEIDAHRSLTLMFDPAYLLTIFDDSQQYESFSVNIQGMLGIYV